MVEIEYMPPAGVLKRRQGKASNAVRWGLFFAAPVIWIIPAVILGSIISVVTGIAFMPFGIGLTPFVLTLLLMMIVRARREAVRRNGQMVLQYLETAVRLNLPIPAFLRAAENSERGSRRAQLRKLRENLEWGFRLSESLAAATDLPEETIQAIAAYESLGQLNPGLSQLLERERRIDLEGQQQPERDSLRTYPLMFLVMVNVFALGLLVRIIPRFRAIFSDFKTPLPLAMQRVIAVTEVVSHPIILIPLVLALVLGMALLIGNLMQRAFLPRLPQVRFSPLAAWLRWRLPVLHGLEVSSGLAAACEIISQALRSGVPFPSAAQAAAGLPVNRGLQKRLEKFSAGLSEGVPAHEAARSSRLPAMLVGVLAPISAGRVDASSAAMFAFLSRYYRQKFSRAMIIIQSAAAPFMVLIMGGLVFCVIYAVIETMNRLILGMMNSLARNLL